MGRIEKTVFISYRRTNMPWALAIYQNLTLHGYDVFFDYDSIPSGDFAQVIFENIRARAHFLVILTPSAMERCSDPSDWLRKEIETAMDERRNIVPVFLEGFDFGSPSISKYLTGKMETLKKYNGQNVPAGFFNEAMQRVRDNFLNMPLDTVLHPVSPTVRNEVIKQQVAVSRTTQVKEKELTAQEWVETAHKHSVDKNFDEAIRCCTRAIHLKPDYATAYNNRGIARKGKDDFDGAIKDYTEAIRLKPDYASAYHNRGAARYNKDDLDGAIKDYTEAIRLKRDFAMAYNNRGNARADKDDLNGAIKDYTEAIRLKPDFATAYNNRGTAREGKDDLEGAIKDYTEAIRLKPDDATAYNNRGNARADKDDLNGAIKDYTEAIRLKPDFAIAYSNRGATRDDKGDRNGAIKDYTEAIRLDPDWADAYYSRAIAWEQKDDYYSAIADFQKCIDLGDKDPSIPRRIQELRKRIK